ncbi:unnamed protein product [Macrosiphum euphorbiae]|uniref:Transposase n=1 Tax=Macrosiphum euphorbiae TaxID=13131 RepID=A0AAV0WJ11_9HEMI|nr:unnamed protein product [Macrosiphum euphorbiae]
MDKLMLTMRVYQSKSPRKTLMPFQKGILMSNNSLRNLFADMKEMYNIKYIITRRLNQDVLENCFSFLRLMGAANTHSTPLNFRYRLRWYILGKHSNAVFTSNRNTEESQSEECLIDSSTVFVSDILKEADITCESENNEINKTFICYS